MTTNNEIINNNININLEEECEACCHCGCEGNCDECMEKENERIGEVYRALYDNDLISKNADYLTKYLVWYEKTNGTADEFVEYVKTMEK